MDFNKIIARAKAILLTPKTEWPVIGGEAATAKSLYLNYFIWLAAIPPICSFIRNSIIGHSFLGVTVRTGIGAGIGSMILTYVLSLVALYVVALIVDALAGTFEAQKNQVQALKVVGYSYTASWVAGIGALIPWLGVVILIAGGIYGIYLIYLGLPHTMKCPPEKAAGYTAVTVIAAIVLMWIVGIIAGGIFLSSAAMHGGLTSVSSNGSSVTFDKDSTLGKLAAMSKRMEAASKKMEAAQKSGDSAAAGKALGTMMGAMSGSNGAVESLAPAQLKAFLPPSIDGLKRQSVSAERNTAMGLQMSEATADYASADGKRHLTLKLSDTGGAKAFLALAGAFGVESDKETADGFDKTWKQDGRMLHAKWSKSSSSGEYSVIIGERFTVEASGNGDSVDDLKDAVDQLDLDKLESLKSAGVKSS